MKHTSLQFQIDQLRQDKIILAVESIAVIVFALFVAAFLPQILIQYIYANQQLFEQPALLQYIPLTAFGVGVAYFIYAAVMMVLAKMKINKLEAELAMLGDSCDCGGNCGCGDSEDWKELDELDKMVEEAMAESKKQAKSTKSVAAAKKPATKTKKASKATSKKK